MSKARHAGMRDLAGDADFAVEVSGPLRLLTRAVLFQNRDRQGAEENGARLLPLNQERRGQPG